MQFRFKAASVWPQPKRIGAGRLPRVFSAGAEARHPPRRPCWLPHGLGVSDPPPCAPPRQAGKLGPFEHCVVGFCGAARVEWAGPAWTKNSSGRAVTCVSFPPSQRRAPCRGYIRGSPLCALLVPFRASEKEPAARGRTPRITGAACGTPIKKSKVLHRCTKRTPARGRIPRIRCRLRHTS